MQVPAAAPAPSRPVFPGKPAEPPLSARAFPERGAAMCGAPRDHMLSLKVVQMSWNFCSSAIGRFLMNSMSSSRSIRPVKTALP